MKRHLWSYLLLALLFATACNTYNEEHSLEVRTHISEDLADQFNPKGRLFLFVNTQSSNELYNQTWPNGSNNIFALNIDNWANGHTFPLNGLTEFIKTSDMKLSDMDPGTYYVQVLWDQDMEESRINVPGNLVSEVMEVDLHKEVRIDLPVTKVIPPRELVDNPHVKLVDIKSDLLSDFWGKEIRVKASVLLPSGYFDNPDQKYPVAYNISGYGGRYTRVNNSVQGRFGEWWFSGEAPQIINVFLDGEGPFGDCYQLDSKNSGPYGSSLTQELIPHIESEFRAIGTPETRFVDGCSTGGWVSFALQVFYPDFFNGCYSFSADAVDFENFQLINIYEEDNAFYNETGYPIPVARQTNGEPMISMKDFIQYENVLGYSDTYVTSGGQFSAFTALYSEKGEDGLPAPLFDPQSGVIDTTLLDQWENFDLKRIMEKNWPTLGPKLQGKIWVWMGDMDNFYLNPAMRAMDEFLKSTTNPQSDAVINFTPMAGHCSEFDRVKVNEMIAEKLGL